VTQALSQARAGLAQLDAAAKQVSQGLAQIEKGRAQAKQGATQLSQGLTKLDQGVRTIRDNVGKARDGRAKLNDGLSKLADAATQLSHAQDLAKTRIPAATAALGRAEDQLRLTTLTAPASGVVVAAAQAGDVLRPGPSQAALLCVGSNVSVATDWGTTHAAHVTRIGVEAEYPPTSQATDEVHLTRAIRVTITIHDQDAPPPGAGVDLTFEPCKEI
jgi:X-X-X-Leu-X-X-Gly heptad repeat protein